MMVDDGCVGMRRGEEYDFVLPDNVAQNVQTDRCDAEWSVDVSPSLSQIDLYGIYVAFSYNEVFYTFWILLYLSTGLCRAIY